MGRGRGTEMTWGTYRMGRGIGVGFWGLGPAPNPPPSIIATTTHLHHLVSISVSENRNYGAQHDAKIQPQAPVLHIPQVVSGPLGYIHIPPEPMDLGPPGKAALYLVALQVAGHLLAELLDEVGPLRPGSHHAHVSQKHIDKLG